MHPWSCVRLSPHPNITAETERWYSCDLVPLNKPVKLSSIKQQLLLMMLWVGIRAALLLSPAVIHGLQFSDGLTGAGGGGASDDLTGPSSRCPCAGWAILALLLGSPSPAVKVARLLELRLSKALTGVPSVHSIGQSTSAWTSDLEGGQRDPIPCWEGHVTGRCADTLRRVIRAEAGVGGSLCPQMP